MPGTKNWVLFLLIVLVAACRDPQPDQEAVLKRGEYLVNIIAKCAGCHSPQGTKSLGDPMYLAGGVVAGTINTPNITPARKTGIGAWTDNELESLLRQGLRPDGSDVHPVMPSQFYQYMTDDDLLAVITYLRSVPPIENFVPPTTEFPFPASQYSNPPDPAALSSEDDEVLYGAYLANLAHCMRCHTPSKNGKRDYENQLGAGGLEIDSGSYIAITPNITPHETDGIAHYSVDDIAEILRTGRRPDGTQLLPMMGTRELHRATEADRHAIAKYLKSLTPKPNPLGE
ncbi:MAG: cytochrome c [Alphaproteobacteria bacterium]|nr:MAG: cytochrome c [Alphaproteobacteria bacterium]